MASGILEVNSVLLVLLMLFILIGNLLILVSIWRNKRLHRTTHLHSISLILANLIPATAIIPLRVARVCQESPVEPNKETALCETYLTFTLLWCMVSMSTLGTMSVDRYIAISRSESSVMTKCRANTLLISIWAFAILISFLPFCHSGSTLKLFNCNFNPLSKANCVYLLLAVGIILLILMFVVHCQIMKISSKHAQSIGSVDSRFTEYRRIPLDFPSEVRWSRVVILIIVLYILMWAPRCIFLIVDTQSFSTDSVKSFDILTEIITYSFAGLVPLVLVRFHSDIREEFFKLTMPFQWFRKARGVGKKYQESTNTVVPLV